MDSINNNNNSDEIKESKIIQDIENNLSKDQNNVEIKRHLSFNQLLKTEGTYVEHLLIIAKDYLPNIRASKFKLKDSDILAIFHNIEAIAKLHESFYINLIEIDKNWSENNLIGAAFLQESDEFKYYGEYLRNFKFSMDTLARFQKTDKKFRKFLEETCERTCQGGLDLHNLLTLPLNRISQYKLQLENLLSLTPTTHEDHDNLNKAYLMTSELYEMIEISFNGSSNHAQLLEAQRRMEGLPQELIDSLSTTYRIFLLDGPLTLQSTLEKKSHDNKKRYVFLFSDICIATKLRASGDYSFKFSINLTEEGVDVQKMENLGSSHGIKLISSRNETTFWWKNEDDRDLWFGELIDCIDSASKHRYKVFGVPLSTIINNEKSSSGIPNIVTKITSYIIQNELTSSIFLPAIPASRKREIRKIFETDITKLDLSSFDSIEIATALKTFVRMLPEPILTFNLFNEFMIYYDKCESLLDTERIQQLFELIQKLPLNNFKLAQHLLLFLQNLIKNSAKIIKSNNENNIDSMYTNLSIIFGSSMLRKENEELINSPEITTKINQLIQFMLRNSPQIFKEEENEEDERKKIEEIVKTSLNLDNNNNNQEIVNINKI